MELDHLFICTAPGGGHERVYLERRGFVETYRRTHHGQGTANVCYALDNAFIELLWVDALEDLQTPAIARTQLYARLSEQRQGACPFGLAWRCSHPGEESPIAMWPFQPPYMPPGISIPVACCSDDPTQPMLFASPGKDAPRAWPPSRRGTLQTSAHLTHIQHVELHHPAPHRDLQTLARTGLFALETSPKHRLKLTIARLGQRDPLTLVFPIDAEI